MPLYKGSYRVCSRFTTIQSGHLSSDIRASARYSAFHPSHGSDTSSLRSALPSYRCCLPARSPHPIRPVWQPCSLNRITGCAGVVVTCKSCSTCRMHSLLRRAPGGLPLHSSLLPDPACPLCLLPRLLRCATPHLLLLLVNHLFCPCCPTLLCVCTWLSCSSILSSTVCCITSQMIHRTSVPFRRCVFVTIRFCTLISAVIIPVNLSLADNGILRYCSSARG